VTPDDVGALDPAPEKKSQEKLEKRARQNVARGRLILGAHRA